MGQPSTKTWLSPFDSPLSISFLSAWFLGQESAHVSSAHSFAMSTTALSTLRNESHHLAHLSKTSSCLPSFIFSFFERISDISWSDQPSKANLGPRFERNAAQRLLPDCLENTLVQRSMVCFNAPLHLSSGIPPDQALSNDKGELTMVCPCAKGTRRWPQILNCMKMHQNWQVHHSSKLATTRT